MIQVYAFTCGQVGVDPCVPDRSLSRNPVAYTGLLRSPKRRVWLPVKAFLVVHPKGKILVDTGWDSRVREHPVQAITYPMWFASKPRLPAGQAVDEQLAALGIKPAELDYVIMSHLDIDHDSGLRLVKDSKRILASAEELAALRSAQVRYVQKPVRGIEFGTIPFASDAAAPYGKSWDVFADGTVRVIYLPGHSQGSVAVKAEHGGSFVLIAGDTGYNKASWQQLKLPGPVYNQYCMKHSLAWVRQQSQLPECKAVLAAHDPGERRNYFEL